MKKIVENRDFVADAIDRLGDGGLIWMREKKEVI